MEKILEIAKEKNMIMLNSEVPLSQSKAESILFEIGSQVFKDRKWLLPLFSESGKKAVLVNLSGDTEFIKGSVLFVLESIASGIHQKNTSAKKIYDSSFPYKIPYPIFICIDMETKTSIPIFISPGRLNKGLPDDAVTPEHIEKVISNYRAYEVDEEKIKRKLGQKYEAYLKSLIEQGVIDCNFNLKASMSKLFTCLNALTKNTKNWFRICPSCLKPVLIIGKAVRKLYCNSCLKHYKAINKRVLKLKKECFSDLRFKEKFESHKIPSDYELIKTYPEKQRQLIGFDYLNKFLEKEKFDEVKVEKHIKELKKWHSLCESLFNFKD